MTAGGRLAGRFELIEFVAAGGLGYVYRGRDHATGSTVAIKLSSSLERGVLDRFVREARVLAALDHPAIVRYLGHGETEDGGAFVAMEWLEGEDLAVRLKRRLPSIREACVLVARIGRALAATHAAGVVHRDIKPSNLFLADDGWDRALLIDFGVAHLADATVLTATGGRPGTPSYMSPEQAGRQPVSASSDVFSLGLVFYECLTGQRCFGDADLFQVLARIILDDTPRVSAVREGVPARIDALIARMTLKAPSSRPSAAEVAGEIEDLLGEGARTTGRSLPTITHAERRFLAVVVASAPPQREADDRSSLTVVDPLRPSAPLAAIAGHLGASLEALRDGSVMAVVPGGAAPAELCSRAARLAIEMRAHLADAPIAVATGRAASGERESIGELIARAAALVARRAPGISLDEVTAALLPARFRVEGGILRGERELVEPAPLLGRRTAFVGRDRELGVIRGLFDECRAESIARAVLVTGAPGIGKSRIAHEVLDALGRDAFELLAGAGDPIGAAPFGLLARATQGAMGILESDAAEARRRKVNEQVARHVEVDQRARIAEPLAELIGGGAAVERSARRSDPVRLGDRIRVAWQDWIAAMGRTRPVLVLLDDLHWGDLATVKLIDLALRNLADRPLLVLALSRPEVKQRFPELWAGREVHELRLGGLRARACSALVQGALGGGVSQDEVAQLVERTDGNPFFLEETIRARARGDRAAPESVLATVQASVEQVPEEGRRLLRAASVFGTRFWVSAVRGLVGDQREGLDEWIGLLRDRELIQPAVESAYAGEQELVFRHALVRDAVYASFVERDRVLAHRLAGDWLERVGCSDPVILAEHFHQGDAPARASLWYLRAAERALQGDDLALVLDHVERARACGPDPDTTAALHLAEAQAHHWRRDLVEGERAAGRAMASLQTGSSAWFEAAWLALACTMYLPDPDLLESLIAQVQAALAEPDAEPQQLRALFAGAELLYMRNRMAAADLLLDQSRARLRAMAAQAPEAWAACHAALRAAAGARGDHETALAASTAATADYLAAGDIRGAAFAMGNTGWGYMLLGGLERSSAIIDEALRLQSSAGGSDEMALANLGLVLARLGRADEAIARLRRQIAALPRDAPAAAYLRISLAFALARSGSLGEAEVEARASAAGLEPIPASQAESLVTLADVLLRSGRPDEALTCVERAYGLVDPLIEHDGLGRLVRVEALLALGRAHEADQTLADARDRIRARAARIADAGLRAGFVENLAEHRRIVELAERRGV